MTKPSVKIGLVQMRIEPGRRQANLRRSVYLARTASRQGAEIILLPEAMPLGWTDPSARAEAEEIPHGPSCLELAQLAKSEQVFLCAGLVERHGNDIFNSAVLFGPDGGLLLRHRKINELELAHDLYALGDFVGVADTRFGRIGIMICADAFARGQVIARTLGYLGAGLILSPCSWAVPADHDQAREPYGQLWLDNYGPVARDFRLVIAGSSNVGWITRGPWAGRKCIGCSLMVGPEGTPILQGPYGAEAEAVLICDAPVKPRPARGDGWERLWTG